MWSIISKKNYENLMNNEFNQLNEEFILNKSEDRYILPRFFYKNYQNYSIELIEDKKFVPKSIDIGFRHDTVTLREEQERLIETVSDIYNRDKSISGIIKARPGFGKTVCAAYISCLLKKKTLIILDNSKLIEQWTEAFINFTTITKDRIGYIRGQIFDSKDITITMVQTLLSKSKIQNSDFYTKIRSEGFDLVIFDETHKTSAAPKFAKSSLYLNSKNVLGLSATPFGDAVHKIYMKNIIGNILYESEEYDLKPKIYFVHYKSGLASKCSYRIYHTNDYIKQIAYYNSIIHNSNAYLNIIGSISKKIVDSNRKGIIIVQSINQLEAIINYLKKINITGTPLHSKSKIINKSTDNLIVATYKMAAHGFDFVDLSSLILATPLKGRISLIQTIGRILRSSIGKKSPIVFDLIDTDFNDMFSKTIYIKKDILTNEFKQCDYQNIYHE